jgi:hypothetical protein
MKLSITSKREGFRRAGRAWSEAPTVVDSKDFTKAQLAAIDAEPMLQMIETTESKGKGDEKG